MRAKIGISAERGREMSADAGPWQRDRRAFAPYQTRTCVRCGRNTTFVLEDAAGGWYACIECGRYG